MVGESRIFNSLLVFLESVIPELPDLRTGKNKKYEMRDAVLSAFAPFFIQSPSFLFYQRLLPLCPEAQLACKHGFSVSSVRDNNNGINVIFRIADIPYNSAVMWIILLSGLFLYHFPQIINKRSNLFINF